MCLNCHVVSVDVELNNLEAIRRACKRLGWQFIENQNTYTWVGKWYDDSPVPRNLFPSDDPGDNEYCRVVHMSKNERVPYMNNILGKCTHAIKPSKYRSEIGLIQRGNKFIPIWDHFTDGLETIHAENGMKGFLQAYAVERTKIETNTWNQSYTETTLNDGSIMLEIPILE